MGRQPKPEKEPPVVLGRPPPGLERPVFQTVLVADTVTPVQRPRLPRPFLDGGRAGELAGRVRAGRQTVTGRPVTQPRRQVTPAKEAAVPTITGVTPFHMGVGVAPPPRQGLTGQVPVTPDETQAGHVAGDKEAPRLAL